MPDPDEKPTPPFGKPMHVDEPSELVLLARTARDTAQATTRTLTQVDVLRQEVGRHLARQDHAIAVLTEHVAGVDGKLDILIDVSRGDRAVRVTAAQAVIEVEKTDKLAKIDVRKAIALRAIAAFGLAASAVLTAILAGKC